MSGHVPRETLQIEEYIKLLLKWNQKISLISRKTTRQTLNRLIDEILQAGALIPDEVKVIYDLGSGNGLPGIMFSMLRPEIDTILVERSKKKALFLEEAAWKLDLKNCRIINEDYTKVSYLSGQPTLVTAIGLDVYAGIKVSLWPHLERGDGLFLFINEANAEQLAANVSCGTYWWQPLPGNKISGISYLKKN